MDKQLESDAEQSDTEMEEGPYSGGSPFSSEKFQLFEEFKFGVDPSINYCFINFILLFGSLQKLLVCRECNSEVNFTKHGEHGLGFLIKVQCSCRETSISSSTMCNNNSFEINHRFIFAMRMLGVGNNGVNRFCRLMELSRGIPYKFYYRIVENISTAAKAVADIVMNKAIDEEKVLSTEKGYRENRLAVSSVGSWIKFGYTSIAGMVSLIGNSTNKVVDLIVKCKNCESCEEWKNKTDTVEYETWYDEHQESCNANHEGNGGKLEVEGVLEMFRRSTRQYRVKYCDYVGDSDREAFATMLDIKPYYDCIVQKKECVLHIQKRFYKSIKDRIKKLRDEKMYWKNTDAGEPLRKRPCIHTRGRTVKLTTKLMADLTDCYGSAIRKNPDSIKNMKNDIWAPYYHKISTDVYPQHQCCPKGTDSWCEWQKAQAVGKMYEHPPSLDSDAQEILKDVYEELSTDEILKRCLGSKTMQNNEYLNSSVWQLAPSHILGEEKILEIASLIAVCMFNEGFLPVLKMLDTIGVKIGSFALELLDKQYDTSKTDPTISEENKENE